MSKITELKKIETKAFFGGLPTDIELAKLREAYPETKMKPGDFFPYKDIENLLDLKWKSGRFRSVTTRWRRVVENETNILINTKPGQFFFALNESEKVAQAKKKISEAGKRARRAYVISSRTDRKALTDEEKASLDHLNGVAAKIHASAQIKRSLPIPEI